MLLYVGNASDIVDPDGREARIRNSGFSEALRRCSQSITIGGKKLQYTSNTNHFRDGALPKISSCSNQVLRKDTSFSSVGVAGDRKRELAECIFNKFGFAGKWSSVIIVRDVVIVNLDFLDLKGCWLFSIALEKWGCYSTNHPIRLYRKFSSFSTSNLNWLLLRSRLAVLLTLTRFALDAYVQGNFGSNRFAFLSNATVRTCDEPQCVFNSPGKWWSLAEGFQRNPRNGAAKVTCSRPNKTQLSKN